jgi:hypothetical protein
VQFLGQIKRQKLKRKAEECMLAGGCLQKTIILKYRELFTYVDSQALPRVILGRTGNRRKKNRKTAADLFYFRHA